MKPSVYLFGLLLLAACGRGVEAPLDLAATASGSAERRISSTADDVEETASGTMVTGSGAQVLNFATDAQIGLRFSDLNVPQGAKITEAYVQFKAAANDTGSTTLTVRAHDSDSAPGFKHEARNVSSRRTTSAAERWSPSPWRWNSTYRSDDLADVVQEVVDRKGWGSGNALALIISGNDKNERQAVASNRSRGDAPKLYVRYESGDGGGDDNGDAPTAPSGSSTEQREWLGRLLATIDNPKYDNYNGWMDPEKQAASGDLYRYGRNFNVYATSLILAYRETGERDLVRHIDKMMDIARGKLRDTNGDGYKNWLYLTDTDASSRPYLNTDKHVMDEMMTHGMVASMAYTLKQAGYSSSAKFWTDYLKNDFEAKWRKRSGKRSGFPFIEHKLMHPTVNMVRYHYYMYKLTGKSDYYSEAKRLSGIVKETMRSSGSGYVWSHERGKRSGCQPMTYVKYTTQALADLATSGSGLFDSTFMKRVAYTVAHKVVKNTDGSYLTSDICGGGGKFGHLYYFVSYPYSVLARWDASGRLELATRRAYAATERTRESSPRIYNLPAIMVFTLGK